MTEVLAIALTDEQHALLDEAARHEYRSVEQYCLNVALTRARRKIKMIASHEDKRRERVALTTEAA